MEKLENKHEKYKQKLKKWFKKLFITSIILGILLMIIFAITTTSISHIASKIILYFGLSLIFIGFIPWGINGYLETRELYYFMKLKNKRNLKLKIYQQNKRLQLQSFCIISLVLNWKKVIR